MDAAPVVLGVRRRLLAAIGATDRYPGVSGRAATFALAVNACATALAAPALAVGGYTLVGAASTAVSLGSAGIALSFPSRTRVSSTDGAPAGCLAAFCTGLAQVRHDPAVRHAVLVAAAVPALAAFDEYLPLLASTMVSRAATVPLLLMLHLVAMTLGALAAARWSGLAGGRLGALLALGGVLLATGALAGTPLGFVGVAVCFGMLQLATVLSNARLQTVAAGSARATVLSAAGLGSEVGAVSIYGGYALGSLWPPRRCWSPASRRRCGRWPRAPLAGCHHPPRPHTRTFGESV